MLRPSPNGPSLVRLNESGETLIYSGVRSMLWNPPWIDSVDSSASETVDLNALLHAPSDSMTVLASGLNSYGQVAGIVIDHSRSASTERVFLWTPPHAHGAVGTVTTLAPVSPETSRDFGGTYLIGGLNDVGQVAFVWNNEAILWIPDVPNGVQGAAHSIGPDQEGGEINLTGLNSYGQVAGTTGSRAFLWTPNQPHNQTGAVMWLDLGIDSIGALNDFGQVMGSSDSEEVALLWTPAHPNGSTGQVTHIPKPWNSAAME
jgi:hypothetical protein